MKLKKLIFAGVALSAISTAALAHDISGMANPDGYTVWVGQQINAHSNLTVHVTNTGSNAKHFKIIYWCWATGNKDTSTIGRDVTLEPNQSYDEQNVECHIPFTGQQHNTTAQNLAGINITPDGEPMVQIRGQNYISVY